MSYTEKHIIETYSGLFEGLSSSGKMALIDTLTKSLEVQEPDRDKDFFKSFGSFPSEKSAEEISADIKATRKFRKKDLHF